MEKKSKRLPSIPEAIISLILVVGVIITGLRIGIGAPMSLLLGTVVATLIALFLHNGWEQIQAEMIRVIGDSMVAIIIIMLVGMTIGVWLIGGTVPALLYYGLKICTPAVMLPVTFVLCAVASTFTGTSFGTMATMGLALVGVGIGIGVPAPMVAGAVISGAYFGDKMSPMSDTTNMAPAMSGTTLYEHIGSMMYSTIPATVVCLILYAVMGFQYAGGTMDASNIVILSDGLTGQFSITPIALIPAILMLVVSARRVPAILGLGIVLSVSVVFAMLLQGQDFVAVMGAAFNGYRSETGVAMVDTLLTRGGLKTVQETVALIVLACMMGGALSQSGVLAEIANGLLRTIKRPSGLVVGTMLYSYAILLLSGNQVLGIIMGGRTFQGAYQDMDVHPKVLSRTLEDTNTVAAPLLPWSVASIYACNVMGVTTEYIPYVFLPFVVPVFSLLCCFTGWGMWRADGTPMWRKGKKK